MPIINISVRNKIAKADFAVYVCNNSDFVIKFDFDKEWDAYGTKTARFSYNGSYADVVFSGSECAVPIISSTFFFRVGVYAGDLHTTTPARVPCAKSILCDGGAPADPPEDIYAQIMEKLNSLDGIEPATADKLGGIKVGDNLSIDEDGTLKANASLPSPTKNGALLIGSGAGSSDAGWTEADAASGYGYMEMSDPIVFTPDKYEAAEKVYITDSDTGEQEAFLVKVSDEVITLEEAKSILTVELVVDGETATVDLAANSEYMNTFGTTGVNFMYGMSCAQNESLADILDDDITISRGTWMDASMAQEYSSITIKHGLKHKISADYIPSNVLNLYSSRIENGEQFDEVREKFKAGTTVLIDGCFVLFVSDSDISYTAVMNDNGKPVCKKFTQNDSVWSSEDLFIEASKFNTDPITAVSASFNKIPCTQTVWNLVYNEISECLKAADIDVSISNNDDDTTVPSSKAVYDLVSEKIGKNMIDWYGEDYDPAHKLSYETLETAWTAENLPFRTGRMFQGLVQRSDGSYYEFVRLNDDSINFYRYLNDGTVKTITKSLVTMDDVPTVVQSVLADSNSKTVSSSRAIYEFVDGRVKEDCLILKSSTVDSTKTFKITVDGTGTISATEVT